MGVLTAWQAVPESRATPTARDSFVLFLRTFGDWEQTGPREFFSSAVEASLAADDYHSVTLRRREQEPNVGLFVAWYDDQSDGGVHFTEICLPGSGWEIAWLERTDITEMMGSATPFNLNRAIIQRGEARMMVYYWFQQGDWRIAWDFAAKFYLMVDGIATGHTDGSIVRLTTLIADDESEADAEARLQDVLVELMEPLPRFVPERN